MLLISPKRVGLILAALVSALSIGGGLTQWIMFTYGHDYQFGLQWLLNLNLEGNLPAWYSSATLLLSAALLCAIGSVKRRQALPFYKHWLALAGIFLYLSIDEAVSIHEKVGEVFAPLHLTGLLYFNWVILGIVFVAAVGVSYLQFLWHLPVGIRRLFLIGGMIYIGGALGIEMIEARWSFLHGPGNLTYALYVWLEETMEMSGIAIFIYALCSYIEQDIVELRLIFQSSIAPASPDPKKLRSISRAA